MNATLRNAGWMSLLAGVIASPVLIASVGADSADFSASPPEAAGTVGYPGATRSPSGIDTGLGEGTAIGRSLAELPDEEPVPPPNPPADETDQQPLAFPPAFGSVAPGPHAPETE